MNSKSPYSQHPDEVLILRDHLAIDRTKLANERTLLAYVRTALGMIVVGLSFLAFTEQSWIHGFAYAFIALGFAVFYFGIVRFRKFHRDILARLRAVKQAED